jgi:hypothetical protein
MEVSVGLRRPSAQSNELSRVKVQENLKRGNAREAARTKAQKGRYFYRKKEGGRAPDDPNPSRANWPQFRTEEPRTTAPARKQRSSTNEAQRNRIKRPALEQKKKGGTKSRKRQPADKGRRGTDRFENGGSARTPAEVEAAAPSGRRQPWGRGPPPAL